MDEIKFAWSGAHEFTVAIEGIHHLDWQVSLATTPATWLMNSMGLMIPDPLWFNAGMLRLMGGLASVMLGAGRLGLTGRTRNGQGCVAILPCGPFGQEATRKGISEGMGHDFRSP